MKIVFCDANKELREFLAASTDLQQNEIVLVSESLHETTESTLTKIQDCEVISTFIYSRLTAEVLAKFPKLQLIATRSTGYNNIDLEYCKKHQIKIANVVGYGAITVAEFTFGLLLGLTRKISIANTKLRNGIVEVENEVGMDLAGKIIGVIGTGAIGRHVVQIANGFGMKVLAYDLYPNSQLIEQQLAEYTDLENIYRQSDIISLNCPSTSENYHLINAETLDKMKNGVYIINTARGELIETADLYHALQSGKVAGAGLDSLEYEDVILKNSIDLAKSQDNKFLFCSLVNQKILQLNNVILTPHIGFNSTDAVERIFQQNVEHIADFIAGKEIQSVV